MKEKKKNQVHIKEKLKQIIHTRLYMCIKWMTQKRNKRRGKDPKEAFNVKY